MPFKVEITTKRIQKCPVKIREKSLTIEAGILTKARHSSGIPVAALASIHEFGTSTVPARPFIGPTAKENKKIYQKELRQMSLDILKGKRVRAQAKELAEKVKTDIQKKIKSNIPPPLAPATVRRKGHNKALIDTGELLDTVAARVK